VYITNDWGSSRGAVDHFLINRAKQRAARVQVIGAGGDGRGAGRDCGKRVVLTWVERRGGGCCLRDAVAEGIVGVRRGRRAGTIPNARLC
jgi:hypothetical protein